MKTSSKIIVLMIIMIAMLMAFTCAQASTEYHPAKFIKGNVSTELRAENIFQQFASDTSSALESAPAFRLPASLQIIEDEAFEGTALVAVDLPETVEEIGDRAFADIPSLRILKIPDNTKRIGKRIVAGSNNVIITAAPGSYARNWAQENGVPFAPITVMTANSQAVSAALSSFHSSEIIIAENDDIEKEKRTARAVDEINNNLYEESIAYHIQGRAPPFHAWTLFQNCMNRTNDPEIQHAINKGDV